MPPRKKTPTTSASPATVDPSVEVQAAALLDIKNALNPQPGESLGDAVRRLVVERDAAVRAANSAVRDDDVVIRETLGALIGISPGDASARAMAAMLSMKLRSR